MLPFYARDEYAVLQIICSLLVGRTMMMRRHQIRFVSFSCCLGLALLLHYSLSSARAQPQQQARTDPSEVAAVNAIFRQWGLRASPAWNISGEPCSGVALNQTFDFDVSYPGRNPGIICDCSHNNSKVCHITKLTVYSLDIVGQIPGELQNLTYLTELNLAYNYLTGSLPSFIGELTSLEYLTVAFNALDGVLPRELGNLKNLLSLGISTNKFVGPLPEILENLTNLKQLYLDSCGLSGELPSALSKLTNLKIL